MNKVKLKQFYFSLVDVVPMGMPNSVKILDDTFVLRHRLSKGLRIAFLPSYCAPFWELIRGHCPVLIIQNFIIARDVLHLVGCSDSEE
jgi:hypothetical protein